MTTTNLDVYEAMERLQDVLYLNTKLNEEVIPYYTTTIKYLKELKDHVWKQMTEEEKDVAAKKKAHPVLNVSYASVLQPWVCRLTFMQQSVLLTAVRGPDGIRKNHPIKVLMRWFRRCTLISAFEGRAIDDPYEGGGGSFTGPLHREADGCIDQYVGVYLQHVDELPHHFQLHLMHAAEIIGYKHPNAEISEFWRQFYYALVKDAHLRPESEKEMDRRLGDKKETWLEGEVEVAK